MTTWRQQNNFDSDSEEDDGYDSIHAGREAFIFVVDANLYENYEKLAEALQIIRGAMLSGLLVNDKDLIGVVFANTQHSPDPKELDCLKNILVPQNCAVFLPLRQLNKDIVDYYLRFIIKAENDFGNHYGIAIGQEGSFANMIRMCCNLFQQCGFKLSNSTIAFFTDRTTPHSAGSVDFQKAIQKGRDLEEQSIDFQLIPMCDDFDYKPFYKEFISLVKNIELDSFVEQDSQEIRDFISDRKLKQDFMKRCLGHLNWTIGKDLEISIQLYNYFQKSSYPDKVLLLRKDNSLVNVRKVTVIGKKDPITGETVDERLMKPGDGWYEFQVGSDNVRLTAEYFNRVKNVHSPGMLLLGFKDKSTLPNNTFIKPCSFIYPDDSRIVGSKRLFRALWQRCLEREKIAVCLIVPRRKSKPRYVALVPTTGMYDSPESNRYILTGDGFKVIYLPMIKNYRNINFNEWSREEASPEAVELFTKVVKKLAVKYNPSMIKDPALNLLEANLLALAFDISTEGEGKTEMPNLENQDTRIKKYLPDVHEVFGMDKEPTTKRKAEDRENSSKAKIAKVSDDQVRDASFVSLLIANSSLSSLTIKQLRIILEEVSGIGIPKSMTKNALIEKVLEQNF